MADFDEFDEFDKFDATDDDGFENDFGDEHDLQQQRVAEFNNQVSKNTKILLSRKQSERERATAAYWLGESGAPKAITALRKVYRGESSKRIKKAAEYALGQFKALDEAIERAPGETVDEALQSLDNAEILDKLTRITLDGKMGKRVPIPISLMTRLMMILTVTLIFLVAGNVLLLLLSNSNDAEETPPYNAEELVAISILDTLDFNMSAHRLNAETIQRQFAEGTLDCEFQLRQAPQVAGTELISDDYKTISENAQRIEGTILGLQQAYGVHQTICTEGRAPTAEENTQVESVVSSALVTFDDVTTANQIARANIDESALTRANTVEIVPAETAVPTESPMPTMTFTPTPTPTSTPVPTVAISLINQHIQEISFSVQQISGPRGAINLLNTFWNDISTAGRSDGCRETIPSIPSDVGEIPQAVIDVVPRIDEARNQLNTTLALLREGWSLFNESCTNGTLVNNFETGLTITGTANSALENVNEIMGDILASR